MYLRERFPIFEHSIYINSCSQGALSSNVQEAYQIFLDDWAKFGSPWEGWVEKNEGARGAFAGLVNALPDEIAVQTSCSAAVSTLASALDFSGKRSKVVVDDFAFPTTAQIWHAQESRGASVVHVPEQNHYISIEAFEAAIDEETLLVSLTHVCYRNGAVLDLPAVIEIAHSRGAMVLLDSFQAVGTLPIDVKNLNVDFLVGGALKYLCGSAGLAWLYIRPDHLAQLSPIATGWFAQDDIFAMDIYGHKPSSSARRFESGTPPVPNTYAGLAGLELVQSVGIETIRSHLLELTGLLKSGCEEKGFTVVTPQAPERHGALIAIRSNAVEQLVGKLGAKGIIVSSRDGNLRVSPHFYNSLEDIETLLNALSTHSHLLI
ncbi:MAG: aminotransferase class V-fold PLP-dependent enzyme [Chloroflexota bacterium]